ncbi:MAG: GMC family oxidoreductase [Alphaproteobacteria bacterium]
MSSSQSASAGVQTDVEFDFVIVGGGTAGCLLANRLSADPNVSVLLIEAGGSDRRFWINVPVGYLYNMGNPNVDWCYKTEADPGLNGRSLNYPRGKVLGGCSSINGMIYMRGQAADYDAWRQMGNAGWGWDDVLPYFKKSENHFDGETEMHGAGGEWNVAQQRLQWEILEAFADACEQAGIPKIPDFNTGDNEGVSYFQVNQKDGLRWNTAKAFLRPAMQRSNLTVWTKTQTERVLLEGRQARALVVHPKGSEPRTVGARREIILSAGSIGSPQILELSGIGDSSRMKELGVQPLHDLPGVGENLSDHLQVRAAFKVSGVKTLNTVSATLAGRVKMGMDFVFSRSGPLTMAPSQLGVFCKSDPSRATANLQYHVQPLSLDAFGEPLHSFDAFTASVCNLRPESRGSVHIRSASFRDAPAIAPNYLSAAADRKVAADALRLTRDIVSQRALAPYSPEEFRPGPEINLDEDLATAAGDISTTIFHPVGTCKMGQDQQAVVDSHLMVHGLTGLRVVDASVMPSITSGNTNSPTLMIAEKAADLITKAWT